MIRGRRNVLTSPVLGTGQLTSGSLIVVSPRWTATVDVSDNEDGTLSAAITPAVAGLYSLSWSAIDQDGNQLAADDYAAVTLTDVFSSSVGMGGSEDGTFDAALVNAAIFICLGRLFNTVSEPTLFPPVVFGQAEYDALSLTDRVMFDNALAFMVAGYCDMFIDTSSATGEVAQVGVAMDATKYYRKYQQDSSTRADALMAQGWSLLSQVSALAAFNGINANAPVFGVNGARRVARAAFGHDSRPWYSLWRDDRLHYDYRGTCNEFDRWIFY